MLQLLARDLDARAAAVRGSPVLAGLAARLTRLLGSLATGDVFIPGEKALLSRDGGMCSDDGSRVRFDPDAPFVHRCGRCGRELSGPRHHRAWITRYQIWLSERAVHLALLGALGAPRLTARAAAILTGYAARYRGYPNEDNVLGPSRPFFSTYLESIWLVQLSLALAMLDASDTSAFGEAEGDRVRAMLAESAALVASFDEGGSNRQVWNGAALLAAGAALDDASLQRTGMDDLRRLLGSVEPGGLWHEGENYHLFALRGFLLGAEIARWLGVDLYTGTALGAMYAAPLATLLPDLTLPARGDAPFGVSVAQPRFAELWEIGRVRVADPRLDAVLAALYAAELPDGDDPGRSEVAEQEENRAGARLRRDRLGWKALLWMDPRDPVPGPVHEVPTLHELPRIVVVRPEARSLVSLECGPRSGGHGHPDLLHLSLFHERPLLADFGTGSYVDPSLHWYRSTLSHNAPGVTGRGQWPAAGVCEGTGRAGPWAWCRVRADGLLGPGTTAVRSVLVGAAWLLDVVTVDVPDATTADLALHPLAGMAPEGTGVTEVAAPHRDAGHESGSEYLREMRGTALPDTLALDGNGRVAVRFLPRPGEVVLSAEAPGPPGPDLAPGSPLRFLIRRAAGAGRWVQVVSWRGTPPVPREREGALEMVEAGGRTLVQETNEGLTIAVEGEAPRTFSARPALPVPVPQARERGRPAECTIPLWPEDADPFAAGQPAAVWVLGEDHYRRSEQSHAARGGTRAEVSVAAQGDALWVRVQVAKPDVVVRVPDAPDPALDNEAADIHSDGVQVYVGCDRWMGVTALPSFTTGAVRCAGVAGTAAFPGPVTGTSRRTDAGYEVYVRLPTGHPWRRGDRVRFTVTVNEMVPGRERRSGQLAMAGGGWVWLRGDRESPHEAVEAEIA
ncbi:MAG TPA: heparinase II/III family protein [Gemmatimonadales bacterium]